MLRSDPSKDNVVQGGNCLPISNNPPPGVPSLSCSGLGLATTDTPPTPASGAPGTARTGSAPWTSDK